eukprot:CAMPEP_0179136688 /NCGR_PEP_ID=MMETSP0796-20121207/65150_1 /TAXON_ID=73915 /ORGANISM="Pyrodinium bahamense, Strain pbaha01" /LENGTH=75 /DNA_ID=CAMNT_0020835789 /DNA_START=13 /DNA_END=240 /DNA_ORIENTATION=-
MARFMVLPLTQAGAGSVHQAANLAPGNRAASAGGGDPPERCAPQPNSRALTSPLRWDWEVVRLRVTVQSIQFSWL